MADQSEREIIDALTRDLLLLQAENSSLRRKLAELTSRPTPAGEPPHQERTET